MIGTWLSDYRKDNPSQSVAHLRNYNVTKEPRDPLLPTVTYAMWNHPPEPFRHDTYDPFHRHENESNKPQRYRWYTPIASAFQKIIPPGGFVCNVFTLCSVTLGGGIIGMPIAFKNSGIGLSIIYLNVVNLLTVYSIAVLGIVIRKTGVRNYEEAGELLFGRWGGYAVGFVFSATYLGGIISYISTIGSLVSPMLLKTASTPKFLKTLNGNHVIVVIIWAVFLVPLVIPKHLSSLRHLSMIGVLCVLLFVQMVFINCCDNSHKDHKHDGIVYFASDNKAIYGLPIFIFAYMNQGLVFNIATEMSPRFSVKQLTLAALSSCTICTVFYVMVGAFGYLDFADKVETSILYNYDPVHEASMMIAYVAMLFKLCMSFAANMVPIRNYLYYLLHWDLETAPYWKHTILVVTTSVVALVGGLYIPSVTLDFGLVGALCGGFVGFIFPALFWMYSGDWTLKTVGIWHYLACYFLLITGVIAMVWGTAATIYFEM